MHSFLQLVQKLASKKFLSEIIFFQKEGFGSLLLFSYSLIVFQIYFANIVIFCNYKDNEVISLRTFMRIVIWRLS